MVEQWTENPRVGSSILPLGTNLEPLRVYGWCEPRVVHTKNSFLNDKNVIFLQNTRTNRVFC